MSRSMEQLALPCLALLTFGCSAARGPQPRLAGSSPPEPPPRILIELSPTEGQLSNDGEVTLFARGTCRRVGTRGPVKRGALARLAEAAVVRGEGPIAVRSSADVDEAALDLVVNRLRVYRRLGAVERVPAAGEQSCRPLSPRSPGGPRTRTSTAPRPKGPVKGSLSKAEIAGPIREALPRFKRCYERRLADIPDLRGAVSVHFRITPDGTVDRSLVVEDTVDPQVAACAAARMTELEFPKPRGGGIVVVTYPFVFAASGARRLAVEASRGEVRVVRGQDGVVFALGACTEAGVRGPVPEDAIDRITAYALRHTSSPVEGRVADDVGAATRARLERGLLARGRFEPRPGAGTAACPAPPPGARREEGATAVLGEGLAPREVREALERLDEPLAGCYRAARRSDPRLEGAVRVRFAVDPEGRPQSIGFLEDSVGGSVRRCLLGALVKARLPRPRGPATVDHTFVFTPK